MPGSQFILFGNEQAPGEYRAFVMSADNSLYSPGGRVRVKVDTAANGQLATTRFEIVRKAVYFDQDLMDGVDSWHKDEDPLAEIDKMRAQVEGRPPHLWRRP